ncbi:MAG: hypothetical protein KAS30_05875 [Candidatus Diapherotrites archaeon]|nr:hypothetical protein [Candidatus Diapherotrites archaeon]
MLGKKSSHSEIKIGGVKLMGEKTDKRIIIGGAFAIIVVLAIIFYVVFPYLSDWASARNPELDNIITIDTGKETAESFIPIAGEELTEQQLKTLNSVQKQFNDPILVAAVYDGTLTELNPKGIWTYTFVDNGTYDGLKIKVDAETNEVLETPLKYTPQHRATEEARNRFTDVDVVKLVKQKTGNPDIVFVQIVYFSEMNTSTETYVKLWNIVVEGPQGVQTYQLDDASGNFKGPF